MKELIAVVLLAINFANLGLGQAETAASAEAAVNSPDTNAPAKPDIKELIKESSFTNSIGMLMVKISPSLWVGKYEVTQDEYQKVTGGNPSHFQGGALPVDSVCWNDAHDFCDELTKHEKGEEMLPEGFGYVLPTQAQWESLVAGTPLSQAATSERTSRTSSAPVGSMGANSVGLCDLRGNLWEFCLDPTDKPYRVLRGGAWNSYYEPNLRLEFRWYANGPDDRKDYYGFRCILAPAK